MKATASKCKTVKEDGSRCGSFAQRGSDYCFAHDPAQTDRRLEAQAQGGRNNRAILKTLPPDAPAVRIEETQDVVALLAETINQVRRGEIDPRIATVVGYLVNLMVKAKEQSELEKRVLRMEALLQSRDPE